jgi:hypothetical protein
MSGTADHRRYWIILRGECQQMLTDALEEPSSSGLGLTCIMASVRDESELYGLLDRIQEFALHIVSSTNWVRCSPARAALGNAW